MEGEDSGTPRHKTGSAWECLMCLLLLGTENGVDCGAADGAGTLKSRFPVLGSNPLRVLHIGLFLALDTIILISHVRVASFNLH